ncbi:hypothetical protein KFE94_01485 [bacterium SCSIO 12643]|nr:hypothetical protein KFE94_01485 [bacterium SCSIO 12643]
MITIVVNVSGETLTDFYTIRDLSEDTIRFKSSFPFHSDTLYPILDDDYNDIIQFPETFRFIGEINDSIVINERYIIDSDGCHIDKLKGKKEIQL